MPSRSKRVRTFSCTCGNRLFFDNTCCIVCQRTLGWCPHCNVLRGLDPLPNDTWRCTGAGCGAILRLCDNYRLEHVCNRMVPADSSATRCIACQHNRTVPDTSIPGNREKWGRLESAKRRLFFILDLLGLSYDQRATSECPALSFDFKADVILSHEGWQDAEIVETVYTGHANGHITINLNEADDVEREKRRVEMNEPHRTLVGHFRHEIAHYYWERLVRNRCERDFIRAFGDHHNPDYKTALDRYYDQGPPDDWASRYVTAYASMHPWEDFAETFAVYLDMVAILDTAVHWGISRFPPPDASLDIMIAEYGYLGLALNEINREMGLLDLVPEIFTPPVIDKLHFVDALIRSNNLQTFQPACEVTA